MTVIFSRKILFAAILAAIFFTGAEPALAHKVTVFAWVDGDMVHTQSKFNGGKKVKAGQVNVSDLEGNLLLTGTTDDQGEFSFKIPKKTGMKIELVAGMGHRGEWTLSPEDVGAIAAGTTVPAAQPASAPVTAAPAETPQSAPVSQASINPLEIQAIVESAVEKKLKPVMNMLVDAQEHGPSASDIFGGIGYIFGLMGVAFYFKAGKRG